MAARDTLVAPAAGRQWNGKTPWRWRGLFKNQCDEHPLDDRKKEGLWPRNGSDVIS